MVARVERPSHGNVDSKRIEVAGGHHPDSGRETVGNVGGLHRPHRPIEVRSQRARRQRGGAADRDDAGQRSEPFEQRRIAGASLLAAAVGLRVEEDGRDERTPWVEPGVGRAEGR